MRSPNHRAAKPDPLQDLELDWQLVLLAFHSAVARDLSEVQGTAAYLARRKYRCQNDDISNLSSTITRKLDMVLNDVSQHAWNVKRPELSSRPKAPVGVPNDRKCTLYGTHMFTLESIISQQDSERSTQMIFHLIRRAIIGCIERDPSVCIRFSAPSYHFPWFHFLPILLPDRHITHVTVNDKIRILHTATAHKVKTTAEELANIEKRLQSLTAGM